MTKRKFEIVIETDPNDKFEPNEQELKEHLRLALIPRNITSVINSNHFQ